MGLILMSQAALAEEPSSARVCFIRQEDGGKMNLVSVRIYGTHAGHERLLATLVGGGEACVDLEPGDWSFQARSGHPYGQRAGTSQSCRSNPLMTDAIADEATRIEVSPKTKGTKQSCGWRLRREREPLRPSD